MRCLFLTSGHCGDYLALEKAKKKGLIKYSTVMMISTTEKSDGCMDAAEKGYDVRHIVVERRTRDEIDKEVLNTFRNLQFDICVLAGFRYLLPSVLIRHYPNKIINSHHSILPANPGLYKKENHVKSDNKLLGATVHFVDDGIDTGKIICQAAFPNYGMTEFKKILNKYRQIQDVLMVTALMLITMQKINDPQPTMSDSVFWPAPDKKVLELFIV